MKTATPSPLVQNMLAQYPPLEAVTRPTVETAAAAHYLNRRPQTLRTWAMNSGTGPVNCIRINGRLAWPVAELRRVLGVV
ncbi:MAG: DNA-binding protein [Rhodoferax sp.]